MKNLTSYKKNIVLLVVMFMVAADSQAITLKERLMSFLNEHPRMTHIFTCSGIFCGSVATSALAAKTISSSLNDNAYFPLLFTTFVGAFTHAMPFIIPTMPQEKIKQAAPQDRIKLNDMAHNSSPREIDNLLKLIQTYNEGKCYSTLLPKLILFHGEPGTGKTLTAKALAGELNVPFWETSASSFIDKYAGATTTNVTHFLTGIKSELRDKEIGIVFIDELDSIAATRSSETGASQDRATTVNALLTQIDGFKTSKGNLIVIGATNRLDNLDPAIQSRAQQIIAFKKPDSVTRKAVFLRSWKKHSNIIVDNDTMLHIQKKSNGFSHRDLDNLAQTIATEIILKDLKEITIDNPETKTLIDKEIKARSKQDSSNTRKFIEQEIKRGIAQILPQEDQPQYSRIVHRSSRQISNTPQSNQNKNGHRRANSLPIAKTTLLEKLNN